jgi:drug/metabolite transporter (DMT)-like permease
MSPHYLIPLLCAFIFANSSLCMKRALAEGAGAMRGIFVTNLCFFGALAPLWWLFPREVPFELMWVAVCSGLVSFLGGLFQLLALKYGDVSVATPLLGGKVIFVALFSTLILGQALPLQWWLGAVLAGIGIFFLGQSKPVAGHGSRLAMTILLSVLSVMSFAMMDILIAGWGSAFGFQRFVVVQQVVVLFLSVALIPFFKGRLRDMPRASWPWLLGGSALIVCQFYLLNWTIATYQDPTALNIFYSSRGLWSVILVWSVGPFFGNHERVHGRGVFLRRGFGAALLFIAICLVLLGGNSASLQE